MDRSPQHHVRRKDNHVFIKKVTSPNMTVTILKPAVVGALACQKDSYLQTLETEVVSCTEYIPPAPITTNGKSKPQKKSTDPSKALENSSATTSTSYLIEFADSVLFPEGGGQPTDHGYLTPLLKQEVKAGKIEIKFLQRHGLRCVAFSPQPLDPGTKVRQDVDWKRRWDHMQQHTGQHVLSAIMDGLSEPLETLGWGMGSAGEWNYVELPRKPSLEELQRIKEKCSQVIRDALPITVETPEGDVKSDSLPEDYDKESGVIRHVKIEGLDVNPCCGTHLRSSAHVGIILLGHIASIRGTNCRLYFACGDRAIAMATEALGSLRNIGVSLSAGSKPEDVEGGVKRLGEQLAESRRREKRLLAEIAKFEGERIKKELEDGKNAWSYRPMEGFEFLNQVTFEVKEYLKERAVVLVSGEVKGTGSILILGPKDVVESLAAKVKDVVSTAKGGGKGEKWQGKVTEWKKGEIEALEKAVKE
jgi:misacylated tRNA(Ala) deacylase